MEPERRIDRTPDDEAGVRAVERDLDDQLERFAREGERVERRIATVRDEWERQRADPRVPGALPPEEQPGDGAEHVPPDDDVEHASRSDEAAHGGEPERPRAERPDG